MSKVFITFLSILITALSFGQSETDNSILITSDNSIDSTAILDLFEIEGIQYKKIVFTGKKLKDKKYHIRVREIWDGKIKSESDIINTANFPKGFQTINASVFKIKVISKFVKDSKLKMKFIFPGFIISKEFDAIDSEDYSLRNIIENNRSKIESGKYFYIFAYLLPYEKDGNKYWCKVENSNEDIENWGVKFGIKHYLIFEMKFDK
jgi:hypothetical protein